MAPDARFRPYPFGHNWSSEMKTAHVVLVSFVLLIAAMPVGNAGKKPVSSATFGDPCCPPPCPPLCPVPPG
jgi:hypothetical protein